MLKVIYNKVATHGNDNATKHGKKKRNKELSRKENIKAPINNRDYEIECVIKAFHKSEYSRFYCSLVPPVTSLSFANHPIASMPTERAIVLISVVPVWIA